MCNTDQDAQVTITGRYRNLQAVHSAAEELLEIYEDQIEWDEPSPDDLEFSEALRGGIKTLEAVIYPEAA